MTYLKFQNQVKSKLEFERLQKEMSKCKSLTCSTAESNLKRNRNWQSAEGMSTWGAIRLSSPTPSFPVASPAIGLQMHCPVIPRKKVVTAGEVPGSPHRGTAAGHGPSVCTSQRQISMGHPDPEDS